jgi:pimeloyl-ACP methyl ester carboxylesterase
MRWRRASVLAVGLLVLATGTGCSSTPARRAAPHITFGSCAGLVAPEEGIPEEKRAEFDVRCGTITVPVEWDAPDGDTIDVQVVRARWKNQTDRIGSLIVNFGGPGQSGLDRMSYFPYSLTDDLLARFDIVTFDPRGAGRSHGIVCGHHENDPAEPQADLLSAEGYAQVVDDLERFAHECLSGLGDGALQFNTTATARDIDAIRRAVGDQSLTYLGYSYGAKLGAEYARQYPQLVRAAVLDAPSDPSLGLIALQERQIRGFEESFQRYDRSCAERPTCVALGERPRIVLQQVIDSVAHEPLTAHVPGDDRKAYDGEVLGGVVSFLYVPDGWKLLDQALREARVHRDASPFLGILDSFKPPVQPGGGNADHAGYVINCNDGLGSPSERELHATIRRFAREFPVFGRWGAFTLFGCTGWPPIEHPLATPTAPSSKPILVVGTRHDPATPYAGAVSLTRNLGAATLLTWDGESHTAYGQSTCIDGIVNDYLISETVPPPDTVCPA